MSFRVFVVGSCFALMAAGLLGCRGSTNHVSPPSITREPASQTVTVGQTTSFTVRATGTAPLAYQWQKNGAALSGATSPSYTTPVTTSSDNGAADRLVAWRLQARPCRL